MLSPHIAIAWSIWVRHRTGFGICALTLGALAVVTRLLAGVVPPEALISGTVLPMMCVFTFVLNALVLLSKQGACRRGTSVICSPCRCARPRWHSGRS